MKAVKVEFDNGEVRYYKQTPCNRPCFPDMPETHYHQVDGPDAIKKVDVPS
jgi:hypothetical protein